MRLVLFGDSFIDPFNHPSMDSWMHIVARSMGIPSHIPHFDLTQHSRYRNLPIGESIDFGQIKSYSLQGSSIEYSQAQLMHYLRHDYSDQDVIIFGITDTSRLPFINQEFNEDHGFGYAFVRDKNYNHWLYYTTNEEKSLKTSMISYILNTLPNKKILIDCFENTRYDHSFHIKGNLYDISNYELGGDMLNRVMAEEYEDTRSNHFEPDNHSILAQKLIRFLDGDHTVDLLSLKDYQRHILL